MSEYCGICTHFGGGNTCLKLQMMVGENDTGCALFELHNDLVKK